MKAIMYHYVRPDSHSMPFFRYLSLKSFEQQLDYFEKQFGFVDKEDFILSLKTHHCPKGVVLTFDDGLMDHYEHVFPLLRSRGLWGIFYVPTAPYTDRKLLDVHRIHVLLGKYNAIDIETFIQKRISSEMISEEQKQAYEGRVYGRQDNDNVTTNIKTLLNFYLKPHDRTLILDEAMAAFFGDEGKLANQYYASFAQLKEMATNDMMIGSHSVHHSVMSSLSNEAQHFEINQSFKTLHETGCITTPKTFCYPYGGFHSFTAHTETILSEAGCAFSFNVEQRDIESRDLSFRPQALPRFDCNQFMYGEASLG